MIIQVACNNLILYIFYSMCSSLPALRVWRGFFFVVFFWHYCWNIGLLLCNIILLFTHICVKCSLQGKQRTRVQMNLTLMFIHSIEIALPYSKTRGTKRSAVDIITHTHK